MRLLHSSSGGRTLASSLGGQLFARSFSSGGLTSSLLSTSHFQRKSKTLRSSDGLVNDEPMSSLPQYWPFIPHRYYTSDALFETTRHLLARDRLIADWSNLAEVTGASLIGQIFSAGHSSIGSIYSLPIQVKLDSFLGPSSERV